MAFSQSFEFGNSTFLNLEAAAKKAAGLDIIQESPPSNGHGIKAVSFLSKSRGNRHKNASSSSTECNTDNSRRRFRKSKSDTTLEPKKQQMDEAKNTNYSDFFRSDFSLTNKDVQSRSAKTEESVLRVSQIEAAFNEPFENSEQNGAISIFEAPICSEDVRSLIETEAETDKFGTENSFSINSSDAACSEDIQNLDTSCFVCPARDIEASQQLAKDLTQSRCILELVSEQASTKSKKNNSTSEKSLSCMSPEQLKWSTTLSTVPNVVVSQKEGETPATTADIEELKSISAWNLPHSVLKEYEKKGVKKMFDWQVACLRNPKVIFEHCNLVYSAPTSAGKTLVSEILLLKTVIERGKKVLLILPFISVVREKMFYLQDLLTPAGYRVEGFFGGYTPPGGFESIHVAICTIEKANSIVNKLMEQGKLDEIGTVVVDEVHLISDPGRGYILELLLAKILYMSRKYGLQIQVITMSATLANVELLKQWLDAELFITDFRPVALQEMIKIGTKIYDNKMRFIRDVTKPLDNEDYAFPALGNDSDHVAQLCIETILQSCSVIVFCPSKDWCENLAVQLASAIVALGKSGTELGQRLRAQINREAIEDVKKQLRDIPTGLDSVLEKTVSLGCAFHHAGLTTEERDIIEASFKSCALKVIVATSTLSSGVNLPARRVLIRSPLFGGKQMSSLTYRQMIGRAGRTGKDTLGESILICTESNARVGRELITADLQPISSCLEMDSSTHLKRALLEVISSGVAASKADIECFVQCTLLNAQKQLCQKEKENSVDDDAAYINDALDFLIEYEFVRLQKHEETEEENYVATRLGLACLASSMPPSDGLLLFAELQKSRRCFVLESELHAVYLVTPYSVCYQLQNLDWLLYLDMWEKLSPAMKKVGELVGVKESFLVRAMRGQSKPDYKLLQIHKRFYTALALQELVNETPINVVAHKFKCTRGILQSLQQMSSTFAGIVTAFCTSLQWSTLTLIVSQFKERLYFGIHRDLIDLMRLPDLTHKRARALFDGGITSLIELANSDSFSIEKILYNSLSFDSNKQLEHENEYETEQRKTARNFFITGKEGMTVPEAAKLLVQEARQFVQYEIGVGNIKWTQETCDQGDDDEMHMSCEDEQIRITKRKLKSNGVSESVESIESAAKVKISEKAIDNLKTSSNKMMEAPKEVISQTINGKNVKNSMVEKINGAIEQKISLLPKENGIKSKHSNLKGQTDLVNERVSIFEKENKHIETKNADKKDNEIGKQSIKQSAMEDATESAKKSMKNEQTVENVNNPKNDAAIKDAFKQSEKAVNPIKSSSTIGHDKPSTSAAARKELMQKQIEQRRLEALKRINKKRAEMEQARQLKPDSGDPQTPGTSKNVVRDTHKATQNKENIDKNNTSTQFKSPAEKELRIPRKTLKERHCVQENATPTSKSKSNTPTSKNNEDNTPKMPRRSPRNHTSSDASAKSNKTNEIDLFMDDDSFMLNTGVTAAMTAAEQKTCKAIETSPASSQQTTDEDEIPSSQQMAEPAERSSSNAQTPHGSRFLQRTQRTQQRLASPKVPQTKRASPKAVAPCISAEPSSSTIELSDMSLENSLIKNPLQLNSSHILSCSKVDTEAASFKSIEIIDICGQEEVFKGAIKELLAAKRFGCSIGLQQQAAKRKPMIGANLLINQAAAAEMQPNKSLLFHLDDTSFVTGVAFSISENIVYYMNLQEDEEFGQTCKHINTPTKLKYLRLLLSTENTTVLMHDAKEQLKVLARALPDINTLGVKLEDPKVANWLLQPDKMLSFENMCQQFAPECLGLVNLCGTGRRCYSSYGLDANNAILAKLRCSIEACVTVHILKGQIENLERIGAGELHKFFVELEMPIQSSLCQMELIGFPVRESKLQGLFQQMVEVMKKLELKIYETNGARFNLGSATAVAKVVGLHRKPSGRVSTSRQILEKLDSPISQLIITYRKLSVTLTKNIQPLLKCVQLQRIHGQSITFTATGRISMTEPNLQNVAKDFDVQCGAEKLTISCRSAFTPANVKHCLISADFCQLEMRILAHLSQDSALLEVMKSERDVFVAIAARWNKVAEDAVSEQLRNGTKQICYGIVYGMGMRSLAESLKCTEQEASYVSQQFHATYPGIRAYTDKVIKFARNNGYIETITGRRRYLDHINSGEPQMKSQAERQAMNSTIQGSAADIAKSAILRMEKNITKYREKLGIDAHGVSLVLHLHDELIFEVTTEKARKIAKVLKLSMESCVKLNVPLKVKLKIGKSWGELSEVQI